MPMCAEIASQRGGVQTRVPRSAEIESERGGAQTRVLSCAITALVSSLLAGIHSICRNMPPEKAARS